MIKIGPSEGNSGALIRWGKHWDNGVWFSWKHWSSKNLLMRFRAMKGYLAVSLLTVHWGNQQ